MDYNEIREALPSLRIACMYHSFGKLELLHRCGLDSISGDFFSYYYELLCETVDFVSSDYKEDYGVETMYFSFHSMMEYYRLCRKYGSRHGLKLSRNPYMAEAAQAVDRIMSFRSIYGYGYGYFLHTGIGHAWASGIDFRMDDYFNDHIGLLEAMLELDAWYQDGTERLKNELVKPKIIPFPKQTERLVAA